MPAPALQNSFNNAENGRQPSKMRQSQMCFADIATLRICRGDLKMPPENTGCSLLRPYKPHLRRDPKKLAREQSDTHAQGPTRYCQGNPQCVLLQKVFSSVGIWGSAGRELPRRNRRTGLCMFTHLISFIHTSTSSRFC